MADRLNVAILRPVESTVRGPLEPLTEELSDCSHADFVTVLRSLPDRFPGVHWEAAVETESRRLVFYEVDDDGLHAAEVSLSLKPDAVWPPARTSDDDWVLLTCDDGRAAGLAEVLLDASPEEALLVSPTTVRLPTQFYDREQLETALAQCAPHVQGTYAKVCDVSVSERYGVILTRDGAWVQPLHFVVDGDDEWTERFRALVAPTDELDEPDDD